MTALPEDAAVAALQASVREALQRIRDHVLQNAGALNAADAQFLAKMTTDLMAIADAEATKILGGKFGSILEEAAGIAVEDSATAGIMGSLTEDMVAIAMYNSQVHIKDLLEDSVKTVNRIITNAVVTGKSQGEVAEMLFDSLRLEEGMDITMARAELIARNEVFSIYRQTAKQLADQNNVTKFKLVGPRDDRTSDICEANIGKVKTAAEWEEIDPLCFMYGLHVNCRHTLDAVVSSKNEEE